jgi:hypothetical protein
VIFAVPRNVVFDVPKNRVWSSSDPKKEPPPGYEHAEPYRLTLPPHLNYHFGGIDVFNGMIFYVGESWSSQEDIHFLVGFPCLSESYLANGVLLPKLYLKK